MSTRPIIFGTAGHIDHGKTTLVRALTGVNTDRLPEEQSRGISIDLGFAEFVLPSGQQAAFVDVPGHERFIRNMVAGVHGMDAVILVVAADEGVMPQTQEHLDILGVLGVTHGITVLTKADLVEDDWLLLVEETTREALQGTFLEKQPIFPVDAVTGRGLDALRRMLAQLADEIPPKPDTGSARLPIDRVFSVKGFGTVVTGTLVGGRVGVEDTLEVVPSHAMVRVRGIQVHGQGVLTARVGQRVALNLTGLDKEFITRGQVLARPGVVPEVTTLVGEVELLPNSAEPLKERTRIHCHLGTSEVLARIYFYDRVRLDPGERGFAELRCEAPVAAVRSDRFLIRSYSPMITIGGGVVLEPGGHHRRREPELIARLTEWASGDPVAMVRDIVNHSKMPLSLKEITDQIGWSPERSDDVVAILTQFSHGDSETGFFLGNGAWDDAVAQLNAYLQRYHIDHGLLPGASRERIRSDLFGRWTNRSLIWFLSHVPGVEVDREWVRVQGFTPGPREPQEQQQLDRIRAIWADAGLRPPELDRVRQEASIDDSEWFYDAVHYLAQQGAIVRLEEGIYMESSALDQATMAVTEALSHSGELSTGDLRSVLDTNRRFAVLILEVLDSRRITKRVGDKRVLMN